MIVKVQISQFSSDGESRMLIYDEKRQHEFEDIASKQILELMKRRPKAFFEAEIIPHPKNWLQGEKVINIIKEAEWQNW